MMMLCPGDLDLFENDLINVSRNKVAGIGKKSCKLLIRL
jgi:hypothetical protein